MLTPHDACSFTHHHHQRYDFSNNTVQDESIESILLAADAKLHTALTPETLKNEVDECPASVVAARATSSNQYVVVEGEGEEFQGRMPLPSRSVAMAQCSEQGRQEVGGKEPLADSEDDAV